MFSWNFFFYPYGSSSSSFTGNLSLLPPTISSGAPQGIVLPGNLLVVSPGIPLEVACEISLEVSLGIPSEIPPPVPTEVPSGISPRASPKMALEVVAMKSFPGVTPEIPLDREFSQEIYQELM